MTTLKDLLGLDYPENSQGKSFVRSLTIDSAGSQLSAAVNNKDVYISSGADKNSDRKIYREALLSGSHKLVVTYDNKYELYNLSQDPDELLDISTENSVLVRTLLDKITVIKKDNAKRREEYFGKEENNTQSERKIDNGTLNQLKALGYIQ
jgi:hypothetical protein